VNGHRIFDLVGASRLAVEAIAGLSEVVEAVHHTVEQAPGILGSPVPGATRGITGAVYGGIRGVTWVVGGAVEALLAPLTPMPGEKVSSPRREAVLAALNGVVGDHLAATDNPLAISMRLRRGGRPLELNGRDLAAAIRRPHRKVLVLVHGACMSDRHWRRQGHDHGAALSRALGYTAVHLHYNSGLHVSTNGRAFSALLEALVEEWPVKVNELAIVAHSMGGLVARSACHYGAAAGHRWLRALRNLIFLGTPHHGAPLERGGNWLSSVLHLSPYTAPFGRLGRIRSAGVTDLRFGSVLDEDWEGRDRFEHGQDRRHPVPLPRGVRCYAIAARRGATEEGACGAFLGDGLVPVDSALGRHQEPARTLAFPESRQWVAQVMNHFDLLSRYEVYRKIRGWLVS
jgi:pimeloyl-ACP methyl ester carboxylesterase